MDTSNVASARTVVLRCGVCRQRDWRRGGVGRADRVGDVLYFGSTWPAGDSFKIIAAHRQGRPNSVTGKRTIRDYDETPRLKCRANHRLWVDEHYIQRRLDAGDSVIYLDAA